MQSRSFDAWTSVCRALLLSAIRYTLCAIVLVSPAYDIHDTRRFFLFTRLPQHKMHGAQILRFPSPAQGPSGVPAICGAPTGTEFAQIRGHLRLTIDYRLLTIDSRWIGIFDIVIRRSFGRSGFMFSCDWTLLMSFGWLIIEMILTKNVSAIYATSDSENREFLASSYSLAVNYRLS